MAQPSPYRMSANPRTPVNRRNERAWIAVQEFRKMVPTLETFARHITGNNKIKVKPTAGRTETDGTTIWVKPPIELGARYQHIPRLCDKRGTNKRKLCAACDVREITMWRLYHEVGHIAFGSIEAASERSRFVMTNLVDEWHPEKAKCAHREPMMREVANGTYLTSMQLSGIHNQYLPLLINALEDARVDSQMIAQRPGLRPMFNTFIVTVFEQGIEEPDGTITFWTNCDPQMQVVVGCFLLASGLNVSDIEFYLEPRVIQVLNDRTIADLCSQAITCMDSNDILVLSARVWERLMQFNLLLVPKCQVIEEIPPMPAPPSDSSTDQKNEQTENSTGEDAEQSPMGNPGDSPSTSSESNGTEAKNEQTQNSPEEDEDTPENGEEAQEDSGDSGEEEEDDAGNSSGDSGGSGNSGDSEDSGDESESDDGGASDLEGDASESGDSGDDNSGAAQPDDEEGNSGDGGPDSGGDADNSQPEESGSGGGSDAENGDDSEDANDESGFSENSGGIGTGADEFTDGRGHRGNSQPGDEVPSPGLEEYNEAGTEGEGDRNSTADESGDGADEFGPDASDEIMGDGDVPEVKGSSVWDEDVNQSKLNDVTFDPEEFTATPEDVARAVDAILGHKHGENIGEDFISYHRHREEEEEDEPVGRGPFPDDEEDDDDSYWHTGPEMDGRAVSLAVGQQVWFDTASVTLGGLEVIKYPDDQCRWVDTLLNAGMFTPPESLIGKAVMKARIVFAANRKSGKEPNLTSGRVDKKKLALRAPANDGRMFYKRNVPKKRDYAVVIGLDCSGSTAMDGRMERIKRAAFAKAEMLSRLGIKFVIYAHTGYRRRTGTRMEGYGRNKREIEIRADHETVWMLEIKGPNEPWNNETRNRLAQLQPAANNFDGHSLEFYRKMAESLQATDKAIIYYTDGEMPAANREEELVVLQREIAHCRRRGIALMAVGINTDSPEAHGFNTTKVESDDDLLKVVDALDKLLTK